MSKQEEIKQALAAATPGPWVTYKWSNDERYAVYQSPVSQKTAITGWGSVTQSKENAHLIAKAPEYIAYLLEENERLRKQLENTADFIKGKEHTITQLKDANDELTSLISKQAKELGEAKEVLRWYSAPEFYEAAQKLTEGVTHVLDDCGERARAFLKGQEGEGNQ